MPKPSSTKQKYGLIAAVRAQKSLYDPKNINFKSNNGLWSQVAAQCGLKRGQIAKSVWKNIRDAYSAYRENPDQNPGRRYCMFFKHMNFIDPYLPKRKVEVTASDAADTLRQELVSKEEDKTVHDFIENTKIEVDTETGEDVEAVETLNLNETTTNREFTTIQYWNDGKDDAEKIAEFETNAALNDEVSNEARSELNIDSDIESYEDIILPEALDSRTIDNGLKMFFDAMFASTSQLPNVLQRTVKRQIFSAVLEAEEEAEKQKSKTNGVDSIQYQDNL